MHLISGHNIHSVDTELSPSATQFNILSMAVQSGVRYYSNVIAYTHAGLHRTETSDGFILDASPPIQGVVYDGTGNKNSVRASVIISFQILMNLGTP